MPRSVDGFVPLANACARLKLSWQTGYRLLLVGVLDGHRIGGYWYVSQESLQQALAGRLDLAFDKRRLPRGRDERGRYLKAAKVSGVAAE